MGIDDYFSRSARAYARYRPGYPPGLFDYLADVAPGRDLAWDCGTGNGQAAIQLADRFARVHATDASPQQIGEAMPHERVNYAVERAESVSLPDDSVDLVTVAVAVHWFDFDRFYGEVRRALVPGGILAVWTYHLPVIEPDVDRVVRRYYADVLAGFWPDRFRYVDTRYRTLPFPLPELEPPVFEHGVEWDLDSLAGFLGSWSAAQVYRAREGRHPLGEVWDELRQAWGDSTVARSVRWPLHLRVGRNPGA
jgi:SAM-dependent methyltransferase